MNARNVMFALSLALAVRGVAGAKEPAKPAEGAGARPGMNFIIIMCDSFRFDTLACYSRLYPRYRAPKGEIQTPHVDRFAQQATIFERCYAGSYPTVANRKDLFTGMLVFPFEGWSPLSPDAVTFAKLLTKSGYWTQMVQDTPHTINKGFNFQRDFSGWEFIRGQETDNPGGRLQDQPGDPAKTRGDKNWAQHLGNIKEIRRFEQDCFCAQTMTAAVHWLEHNYDQGKFALYIDTFDPHEPWAPPHWYEALYADEEAAAATAYRYPIYGKSDVYTKAELARMRTIYAAEVSLVDRWVGFLLESVERMGLMDNTCVIFTADHGVSTGDHGWTGKNAMPLYEIIAHVPLLIHTPGQTKSRRVDQIVQHCDIMPTMMDLAGETIPPKLSGLSLRPLLEGRRMATREFAFTRGDEGLLVTSDEWSLVYPLTKEEQRAKTPPELFNLSSDPRQTKDVLRRNRGQAREMWDAYAKWMAERTGEKDTKAPMRP